MRKIDRVASVLLLLMLVLAVAGSKVKITCVPISMKINTTT